MKLSSNASFKLFLLRMRNTKTKIQPYRVKFSVSRWQYRRTESGSTSTRNAIRFNYPKMLEGNIPVNSFRELDRAPIIMAFRYCWNSSIAVALVT